MKKSCLLSRGFLGILLVFILPLSASDTASISALLTKYESRGLPRFRVPELYVEISERLQDHGGSNRILAGRYLRHQTIIESERRKQQLPWFIGFLPASNTGFEARYRNESGYAGMWPMPYLIGKKYGLVQMALYDQRHDPQKSTEAACKYLTELQIIYRDWLKTITAFSIGPARLNQVIHTTKSLDFDTLYYALEPEERIPVIQFIAASVAISELLETGKTMPDSEPVKLVAVNGINQPIPFSFFDTKMGLGIAQMREFNPGLRVDLIPYMGKEFVFYLPESVSGAYNRNRDSIYYWLNGVPRMEISYDTVTQVYDGDSVVVIEPEQIVEIPPTITKANEKVWVYYKIKRGDALYTITDVFDCSIADIRRWNNLNQKAFLVAGKSLKFYVPVEKKKYYQQIDAMSLAQKRERAQKDD